ncbi:amidohydrolase family protein [Altererythrobacter aerius]|uniref:Amidohydrolase family protein n=1 Tax=Tsuneonella aeria TaxID=1837929 RepID=A0A6I4TBS5_9SPHN|nr:amidohydrolase family protein [Tsuneonella aeria]MXO74791.1 amidohydrolase family protein [Tsuneonella aeria]
MRFLLFVACSFLLPSAASATGTLTIRNITIVDPVDGTRSAQDVVIQNDRIVAITATGAKSSEALGETTVVDGTGKYLIPGLWDMHGHVSDEASGPLYILNGVTGVRQIMGHSLSYAWRHRKLEATPAMPRMYLGSTLVDGKPAHVPGSIEVSSIDEARQAVRTVKSSGAEFLKIYSKVPADAYEALIDEARKLDVRVEGHVPDSVSWASVAKDGKQRSIEHLWGLPRWVASNAENLSERTAKFYEGVTWGGTLTPEQQKRTIELQNEAYDNFDPRRFADLVRDLKRNRVWQSPTLIVWETRIRETDPALAKDPRLALIPQWMREFWKWKVGNDGNGEPAARALSERRHKFNLDRLREMHASGVPILAGTDSPLPYNLPGWSLHDELALLVEAGLTPKEALQAATSNAGQFIGRNDIGRVRPGAIADLVITTADPTVDIRNTRKIDAVIIGGRLIDRTARDAAFQQLKRKFAAPTAAAALTEAFKDGGLAAAIATYEEVCPAPDAVRDCSPIDAVEYTLAPLVLESPEKDRFGTLVDWAERRFPDDVEVQTWVALEQKKASRPDRSKAALQRALQLAPGSPFLLHHLQLLKD